MKGGRRAGAAAPRATPSPAAQDAATHQLHDRGNDHGLRHRQRLAVHCARARAREEGGGVGGGGARGEVAPRRRRRRLTGANAATGDTATRAAAPVAASAGKCTRRAWRRGPTRPRARRGEMFPRQRDSPTRARSSKHSPRQRGPVTRKLTRRGERVGHIVGAAADGVPHAEDLRRRACRGVRWPPGEGEREAAK